MKSCAYCSSDEAPTREHIIPKYLYSFMKDCGGDQSGFSFKTNGLVKSEAVIKDVCSKCNSGFLSYLDEEFKNILEKNNLLVCMHTENEVLFKYNYDFLLRWILKVLYNSYRSNYGEKGIYKKYISYMVKGGSIKDSKIYILTELINIKDGGDIENQFAMYIFDEHIINKYLTMASMRVGSICFYIPIFDLTLKNHARKKLIKKIINLNGGNMYLLNKYKSKLLISKTNKSLEELDKLRFPINS